MSRKKPTQIKVRSEYNVEPEMSYKATVVPSGSGAVIKSFKKYIGYEAIVILEKPESKMNKKEQIRKMADLTELSYNAV